MVPSCRRKEERVSQIGNARRALESLVGDNRGSHIASTVEFRDRHDAISLVQIGADREADGICDRVVSAQRAICSSGTRPTGSDAVIL